MVAKMTMTTEGMQLAIPPASTSVIDARILGQIPSLRARVVPAAPARCRKVGREGGGDAVESRKRVAFNPSAA